MPRQFLWFADLVVVLSAGIGLTRPDPQVTPFLLVLVPAVAATAAAAIGGGRPGVRPLLSRIARWRIAPRYYAVAIGVPLLFTVLNDVAGVVAGQSDAVLLNRSGQFRAGGQAA